MVLLGSFWRFAMRTVIGLKREDVEITSKGVTVSRELLHQKIKEDKEIIANIKSLVREKEPKK